MLVSNPLSPAYQTKSAFQERDGWYTTHAFEQIKTVLRHKFFSLLEGHVATDEESRALLTTSEGSARTAAAHRSSKLRPGKHNMAKGALRPEDAAVSDFVGGLTIDPLTS